MAVVSLPLVKNVLHAHPQTLDFDRIATFIGGNGSGKSTILKSIFDEKLKGTTYEKYKVVCFSSGQNENYSDSFRSYLDVERNNKNAFNLDCFYYDKLWSMLLIFLATTSKEDGEVRAFLKQNNYISENDFAQDESTKLSFQVKAEQTYTNLVQQALDDDKEGLLDIITNKAYHRTLNNFITELINYDYNFTKPLETTNIKLDQEKLSKVSFEKDEDLVTPFDSKVMFFTIFSLPLRSATT